MTGAAPSVIKVGGSVLRDRASYGRVVDRLIPELASRSAWLVVSAARGVTDALVALADEPGAEALIDRHVELGDGPFDPYLAAELRRNLGRSEPVPQNERMAWGERASAAVIQHRLSRLGVSLPIVEFRSDGLLTAVPSAIVPGFYVRSGLGEIRCLSRGGSDVIAALLAERLGVGEVRFWKEGGGIRIHGDLVPEISAREVLPHLVDPVRPIHRDAVQFAGARGIDLVLEDPWGDAPSTRIRGRAPSPTAGPHHRGSSVDGRTPFELWGFEPGRTPAR